MLTPTRPVAKPSAKPLAIDLFCGKGGWAQGLIAAGWNVVGFDVEDHGGYPAQLVMQDVKSLDGRQFKEARLIVASPPCQWFSFTSMPFTRGKRRAEMAREHPWYLAQQLELFHACFRIQHEASAAAGRHIPMVVVENVRGARPWVPYPCKWNFGSYYLWGDVPALMPPRCGPKKPGASLAKGWNNCVRYDEGYFPLAPGQKQNPDGTDHGPRSWFAMSNSRNRGARSQSELPTSVMERGGIATTVRRTTDLAGVPMGR